MFPFPMHIRPEDVIQELSELSRQMMEGLHALSHIREEQIQIGTTPKEEVCRDGKMVLYHYTPFVDKPFGIPLLIVYALVNRPYMVDLQENRSLVRNLLDLGLDIYLLDWGYPTRADRWLTLEDHILGYIGGCVDAVRERHGLDQINLLGICQGGTFSLCYAALSPGKIKNLLTMVTPVDFHVESGAILNTWSGRAGKSSSINPDLLVQALGNIPGDFMNFGFLMLKPFELGFQKYLDALGLMDSEEKLINFLRMEKWIFDSPDQAGETWRRFIRHFYQENGLIKGQIELDGQRVDLQNVTMPVLNVYAEHDHLVPPESSQALGEYVGTDDYTVQSFPVGHIGMYVSSKVQRALPPTIAEWIMARG
jgi:polyhydroxyalkanoate synthase